MLCSASAASVPVCSVASSPSIYAETVPVMLEEGRYGGLVILEYEALMFLR